MSAVYVVGAEDPSLAVTWLDVNGQVIDFSGEWDFVLKLFRAGHPPVLIKTSGISGSSADPNLVVVWSIGELEIAPGLYRVEIKATREGRDRFLRGQIEFKPRSL